MHAIDRMVSGTSAQPVSAMAEMDVIILGNADDQAVQPPPGSARLTVRTKAPPTIHVFGTPSTVACESFPDIGKVVYLLGRPSHATLSGRELLKWACERSSPDHHASLRELFGLFTLVIDDRSERSVTFISDILGIRPMFVGTHAGKLVAGNNVLKIASAGLSSGKANYDAVATWLRYNQPADEASVLEGFRQLAPAIVSTFRADGSQVRQSCYGEVQFGEIPGTMEEAVDESFDAVRESIRIQTRELAEVNLPLSGGYDSRLVFAIASQLPSLKLHLATLNTRSYEATTAQQVATAMGHQTKLIQGRKRILDLFDDPFCLTPSGFITGRNLTSFMARTHPGMPLLSGFMGDGVMRGSMIAAGNAFFAKDAETLSLDAYTEALDKRYTMHAHRTALLKDSVRRRANERAMACMRSVAHRGMQTGRPTVYGDMYCRQRFYYANVILQHLDVAEGIAAFCNYRSLNCRAKYQISCFGPENYPKLFEKFFPPLGRIPHSYYASPRALNVPKPATPPTRHLRRWSADLAAGLVLTDVLNGAKKRKIFSLLPSGLLGEPRYQDEMLFLYKLMMFERTLDRHGVKFAWDLF